MISRSEKTRRPLGGCQGRRAKMAHCEPPRAVLAAYADGTEQLRCQMPSRGTCRARHPSSGTAKRHIVGEEGDRIWRSRPCHRTRGSATHDPLSMYEHVTGQATFELLAQAFPATHDAHCFF